MTVSSHFALGSALAALAAAGFWGYCLFNLARTGQREVRTFSKPAWGGAPGLHQRPWRASVFHGRPASAAVAPKQETKAVTTPIDQGLLPRMQRGSAQSSGGGTVNHCVRGKPKLSAHPHNIESVIAHSDSIGQYSPRLEAA
jgi:hypothetical protein